MPRGLPHDLSVHWRGHVFRFGAKTPPRRNPSSGLRLLLIVFLLEGVFGPRLWLFTLFGQPLPPSWLRVSLLLSAALILVRFWAGFSLSQIGFYRWREWSLALLPLLRSLAGPADVHRDLHDWPILCRAVSEVRQSVDGRHSSWSRRFVHCWDSRAMTPNRRSTQMSLGRGFARAAGRRPPRYGRRHLSIAAQQCAICCVTLVSPHI